ncbi:DUF6519 domain-containing protein [Ideonella azotifigens]|uniref:Uncharacterized protein n=1 Tax=Ideonella azotifigens TaxID=513160 RepID=A0ABN1KER6_9BURK|nr:DUF6519 domain-containing protein [Ideonella azotifigens]MCD2340786.1 DUF6519 domain-containing protein [Ideonella azotifigens]
MKGDFTRFGFDSSKHYSRVLHQQGRVALDADSNEASAILLHHLRLLTRDLFGAGGGPPDSGFSLDLDKSTKPAVLSLAPGHYYVDGILCENEQWTSYADQPDYTPTPPVNNEGGDALLAWLTRPSSNQAFWVYLDVWERHVSWIEDDSIREPALGGPDTCTRAKVIWQVKALPWDENWGNPRENQDACNTPLSSLTALGSGLMTARLDPGSAFTDPCIVSPDAAYRGAENQLYRVEVHRAGVAGGATFKWSRENGSVAARWLGVGSSGDASTLSASSARGFTAGDWVELSHDALDLANEPGQLVRISVVDGDQLVVDSASVPGGTLMAWSETLSNPKLRRWDQHGSDIVVLDEGAVPIIESNGLQLTWLDLEDGVQVAFETGGDYRSGEYWLIPARVATQGIAWPAQGAPDAWQAPQGIVHHFSPLGVLVFDDNSDEGLRVFRECRHCLSLAPTTCAVQLRQVINAAEADATQARTKPRRTTAPSTPNKVLPSTRRRRGA